MNVSPPAGHDFTRGEVYELADALLCDGLSDDKVQRLEKLLCADAEARRHYVSFMHLSAKLCRWNSANTAQAGDGGVRKEVTGGGQAGVGCATVNDDFPAEITAAGDAGIPYPSPSVLLHGFSFVNSAILSYAAVGLIMGAAVLATWTWGGGGRSLRVANDAHQVAPAATEPSGPIVGRITAMLDCRWANPAGTAAVGDLVPLGRRYDLASGWLQIRYHTGAVVAIYGPAAYQANSVASGFLFKGTARVWVYGTTVGGGLGTQWQRTEVSPNVFAIHTSNAALFDIQGNFSVTIDPSGATHTRLIDSPTRIMAVYAPNGLRRDTICSTLKGWYFVDDNPRGFTVVYRNDPKPWGLWSSGDGRFGWSEGTLDLEQWRARQCARNAKPESPVPN